ncbi:MULTISPECIES: lipopolysaccharide biosynthesis protein [unclassified Bosea (in: a-proteobacteria)]|uniref:lipopolysaccharide biosynthesis protein n=1 Tax=unclassified Bosea (in: a-proteobacteria) TaxID=2653178 RepID=UPI00095485EE|nr:MULTISPECIES: lipopolysaccharide biosynthesis protein [unclassified Bosea (in: a-proteobacteria)]TAJ28253.1 MAG: lipopolysaccharide biosynthesis protein [Bosea sp. (in: a-proteobacteria)]SIR07374.1 Membrane protein involved in the export of O-antigen and teichoic acid [Bosea sp. TND4EK4]
MIALLRHLRHVEGRRFISAFSSRFSSTLLSFLVLLTSSHFLPTQEYGLYVFLFSVGSALGLIAVLGQQILVVKHYQRKQGAELPQNQALLGVNAAWLGLGNALLLLGAAILYAVSGSLPETYRHLWLAFVFAAVFSLSEYLQNYFRIHGEINLSLLPREIVWRGGSILAIGAAGLGGILGGGQGVMLLLTALLFATTFYQCAAFLRREGTAWLRARAGAPAAMRAEWHKESGYFIANGVFISASAYFETILIGVLLGLDKAGFYFVALRIAMLLTLPVAAIDTVGIPMIAARVQNNDMPGVQKLVAQLSFGSFVISLAGGVCLAVLAPFVLTLFNPEFVRHEDVLTALCVLAVVQAFFGPGSWLLMIGGGERYFLGARAILFVFYIGLLWWLGSIGGLMGIAIASVIFTVALNLVAWHWVKSRWGVDNMASAFIRPFLFGGRPTEKPFERPEAAHGAGQ